MGADDYMDGKYVDIAVVEKEMSDPRRMEKIADHLSCGGTLIDYCKLVGQSFIEMKKWIKADEEREKMYEAAKLARQEWLFERVLTEYRHISGFSLTDIYNKDGGLLPVHDWPESARAAVAGIESLEKFEMVDGESIPVGTVQKIKLWDKNKALQDIGRHLKMFAEVLDINLNTTVSIVDALAEAEARMVAARPVRSELDAEFATEVEYKEEPI